MMAGRANKKTIEANKAMAKYSYQKNLEMFNRTNEYNLPSAQRQRMIDANINPALMYGDGNVTGNVVGQGPQYDRPETTYEYRPMQTLSALQLYQDMQLKKAQIDNVNAQTAAVQQRTINDKLQSMILDATGKYKSRTLEDDVIKAAWERAFSEWKYKEKYNVVNDVMPMQQLLRGQDLKIKELVGSGKAVDNEIKKADLLFKQYRNKFAQMGIMNSDNFLVRLLVRASEKFGLNVADLFKE